MRMLSTLSAVSALALAAACSEPDAGEPDPVPDGDGYESDAGDTDARDTDARDTDDGTNGDGRADPRYQAVWHERDDPPGALFGPPDSEALFAVMCRRSEAGEGRLVYTWHTAAESGASGEIRLSGNGESAVIPVSAIATELGPDFVWQGEVASGDPSEVVFRSGDGPVTLTIGDSELIVPSDGSVERVYAACR